MTYNIIKAVVVLVSSAAVTYLLVAEPAKADENASDPSAQVENPCSPGDWGPLQSVSRSLPGGVTDAFNAVANKVGLSVSGVTVSANMKQKDCCKNGDLVPKGVGDVTGTVAATIAGKKVAVPGLGWSGSIGFETSLGSVSLNATLGVTVSASLPLTGSVGETINQCDPNAGCFHCDLGLTGGPGASGGAVAIEVSASAQGCFATWLTGQVCADVDVTPVGCATSISGFVGYNEPECSPGGVHGSTTVGAVVLYSNVSAFGTTYTITKNVFNGYTFTI